MDTLVFDIETSNFFTDPEVGWNNFDALKISVVGIYSYLNDKYYCLEEKEMREIADLFRGARQIVGFSSNNYDIPVLNLYFQRMLGEESFNLWDKERFDIAEKIENHSGRRISLSRLAEANLGEKKERHGSEAISLFKDGRIEELKNYCLKDVRLTKELFDLYQRQNYFLLPDRETGEMLKVDFGLPVIGTDAQTATLF